MIYFLTSLSDFAFMKIHILIKKNNKTGRYD